MSYTATGIKPHGFHRAPTAGTLRKIARAVRTGMRAAKILATSRDLPLMLRILFVVGCIQIPVCPLDEVCMAIALVWMFAAHRAALRNALTLARQA